MAFQPSSQMSSSFMPCADPHGNAQIGATKRGSGAGCGFRAVIVTAEEIVPEWTVPT
jgi:acyl CoA:acetate/3-ketoacid CoA transferase alpha subunit